MNENPPSNVPNQGPIELQLLALQKELSFFKSYYIEMNKKINEIHDLMGNIEHFALFTRMVKLFDEFLSSKWKE